MMGEFISNFGGTRIHSDARCGRFVPGNVRPPTDEERAALPRCKTCTALAEKERRARVRASFAKERAAARLAALATMVPKERRAKVITTVYLEPAQHEALVRASVASGRASAELVREAVDQWLARRIETEVRFVLTDLGKTVLASERRGGA